MRPKHFSRCRRAFPRASYPWDSCAKTRLAARLPKRVVDAVPIRPILRDRLYECDEVDRGCGNGCRSICKSGDRSSHEGVLAPSHTRETKWAAINVSYSYTRYTHQRLRPSKPDRISAIVNNATIPAISHQHWHPRSHDRFEGLTRATIEKTKPQSPHSSAPSLPTPFPAPPSSHPAPPPPSPAKNTSQPPKPLHLGARAEYNAPKA